VDQGTVFSNSFQERMPIRGEVKRTAAISAGMAGCHPCQKSTNQRTEVRIRIRITRISFAVKGGSFSHPRCSKDLWGEGLTQ
jgi:hypothetical protein